MVLLVEDDDVLRRAIERILLRNGYEIFAASNGNDALALLDLHQDDEVALLLTDVVMPKMLGRELAFHARAKHPGIRVLFMSGYAASALGPANTLEVGSVLLKKPFGEHDLLAKVSSVLRQESAFTRDPLTANALTLFEQRKPLRHHLAERELPPEEQGESDAP